MVTHNSYLMTMIKCYYVLSPLGLKSFPLFLFLFSFFVDFMTADNNNSNNKNLVVPPTINNNNSIT